ncbi:hypothetical protein T552_00408 [Pneumocystis carinii B80]|uniref:Pre-mRNA-splicing factor CLF1 n=1 Tax=Pneumocystis carinii (strain B80) TaxID=1408658 RepID=A0A0W4ZQQ9_PNEC8|nr:hypothetical protein T552_00408 [Pneumocystis carinii B80]KTW30696.1 hypothetical protein T552_00408 [Pneumocystis carinii B80]
MSERGPPRIKNKAPAPIQITAEQLLREAFERQEPALPAPKQRLTDLEELHELQGRKRKEFEDAIRRNRLSTSQWVRYAQWELEQKEFARARSIFERALDVDATNIPLWLHYLESEIKHRNINHARNLFDRVVTLMPRVDKFWFKYVYMEETLGNISGTRQIFERWMSWEPDEAAWHAYIRLEERYNEIPRARAIFERFISLYPEPKNWIKWANFEQEYGTSDQVREVFTTAIDTLGEEFMDEKVFIAYGKFETKLKEYERARVIYRYALDRLPKSKSEALYNVYSSFEKQFGDKEGIEDTILAKRRVLYEEQIKENPKNYDAWFDYINLEESSGDSEKIRNIYERAIAHVPPSYQKKHWRRYIYIWIFYALYEELETKDYERSRQIYRECLKLIPHKIFTFSKIWVLYAKFEIRQLNLSVARKYLGMAIGMCPKNKLFKEYIELELQLREFDRCRTLYEKFIEYDPYNCYAWIKYAELEHMLEDYARVRAIFELAIEEQHNLDMPELLWKAYIDFEFEEGEYDRTRILYERLLEKTQHVKVWISFAHFEFSVPDNSDDDSGYSKERARNVFQRAYKNLKEHNLKEERVILLEAWKQFEISNGDEKSLKMVEDQMPQVAKSRRKLDDGTYEEYYDYIFPTDEDKRNFKLLAMAQKWAAENKKKQNSTLENST